MSSVVECLALASWSLAVGALSLKLAVRVVQHLIVAPAPANVASGELAEVYERHLFPPIEPYATHVLHTGLHRVYTEECGNPKGVPILFVHGGPGNGCGESDRRWFDPAVFRIILVDQRGCGRSLPISCLEYNNIDALVADFETLRTQLGIDQWHIFGGSWGSTLALYYAAVRPMCVLSIIARGIWLLDDFDVQWWLKGISTFFPEEAAAFEGHVPPEARTTAESLLHIYYERLKGDHGNLAALAAAKSWAHYELSCCTLLPSAAFTAKANDGVAALSLALLEAHYFVHCKPDLLARCPALAGIPVHIVHGRYDMVCPPRAALALHAHLPASTLVMVAGAGHSSHEEGVALELIAATKRLAGWGDPRRWPINQCPKDANGIS